MDIWTKKEEASRLEARFKGIKKAEFARKHHLNPSYMGQHIAGTRPISRSYALAYARAFGVPISEISPRIAQEVANLADGELLEQERTSYNIHAVDDDEELGDEWVRIPVSAIAFSAGPGYLPNYEVVDDEAVVTYRRDWFQKNRINPKRVRRFRVVGDSMEPFVFAGDSILVNLDETNIVDGKVYAIRYGDDLRVKILSRRLDGMLTLRSFNSEKYRDEEVTATVAAEQISVIGRVRDKSGSGGL